jgi:hypothetical protein
MEGSQPLEDHAHREDHEEYDEKVGHFSKGSLWRGVRGG